ncbi:MAG: hypothetical protein QOE63_808 [Acidimicrobiaceae bacterium]
MTTDWDSFARRIEAAVDMQDDSVRFTELFAPGASFADPANPPTDDIRDIQRQTASSFPDWRQEVTSMRGADSWAVFEWIGRATFAPPEGAGIPIEMHGCTLLELDADGRITAWRDYLDRKEPEQQIRRALKARAIP